jgi:hypothetical protein
VTSLFAPALETFLGQENGIFGPTSFQSYLTQHSLPRADTARSISVDTYERLNNELKRHHAMVLRLGSSSNESNTRFALVKVTDHLNDFFLFDDQVMTEQASTFLPTASFRQLYPYQLLGLHSETALVNLGFASGLINRSLDLDEDDGFGAPATGQSTFTFTLKAHQLLDSELKHSKGQIQIDALFVGKRDGKECLFVIEAKCQSGEHSLAKHKLVYPIMALAAQIPKDIGIVPVYVKILKVPEGILYHIVECHFPDPRERARSIDELRAVKHTGLLLPLSIVGR